MKEAAAESPHLEGGQKDQAARHAPLRALVIHEIIRAEGEDELERDVPAMIWSGLAAGLSNRVPCTTVSKVSWGAQPARSATPAAAPTPITSQRPRYALSAAMRPKSGCTVSS